MGDVPPPRFADRVGRVQKELEPAGFDLLYVGHSTDLEYLTGVDRPARSFGPARYFAHWAMGALITATDGPLVLVPRMLAEFAVTVRHGELRIINEDDSPEDMMAAAVRELAGDGPARIGVNVDAEPELLIRLAAAFPSARVELATSLLGRVRALKDDDEVAALRRVCETTERVYEEALEQLPDAAGTAALSRWMSHRIREVAADESFRPGILFIGSDGNSDAVAGQGCLRFDFGVAADGYCTDFGRTVHLGEPSQRFLEAFEIVAAAQREAAAQLRPGTPASAVDAVAREAITDAGYGEYFRHRVGHGIGMDVNEPPYLEVVDDTPLETGMTFTVEPGIWIPGELIVFQEDIYRVTDDGGERLNRSSQDLRVL
jgi:Xaa-Pro aminopeptidase